MTDAEISEELASGDRSRIGDIQPVELWGQMDAAMDLSGRDASRLLRRIAALMEVRGDDTFRVRAFTNAARAIERLSGDVGALARGGELLAIKGVGKGTASILADAARGGDTGRVQPGAAARMPPDRWAEERALFIRLRPQAEMGRWSNVEPHLAERPWLDVCAGPGGKAALLGGAAATGGCPVPAAALSGQCPAGVRADGVVGLGVLLSPAP